MSTQLAGGHAPWTLAPLSAAVRVHGKKPAAPVFTRAVAALAVAMGVGHVWVMLAFPHGLWVGALLGLMVLPCLKCAHRAWSHPAAMVELLAMSALMAMVHMFMALGVHEHHHGVEGAATAASTHAAAMLVVAGAELVMAMLCGIGMRLAARRSTAAESQG